MPIVYCSQSFEVLTGYSEQDALGRNCRFLQSFSTAKDRPDLGSHRVQIERMLPEVSEQEKLDLVKLRCSIANKEESQVVLTNYKKNGDQFRNVLATIPIQWTSDSDQSRYIVGFLADLEECSLT